MEGLGWDHPRVFPIQRSWSRSEDVRPIASEIAALSRKNQINESFSVKDGTATWKNQAEDGHESSVTVAAIFSSDSTPDLQHNAFSRLSPKGRTGLLKNGNKLPRLPGAKPN